MNSHDIIDFIEKNGGEVTYRDHDEIAAHFPNGKPEVPDIGGWYVQEDWGKTEVLFERNEDRWFKLSEL